MTIFWHIAYLVIIFVMAWGWWTSEMEHAAEAHEGEEDL